MGGGARDHKSARLSVRGFLRLLPAVIHGEFPQPIARRASVTCLHGPLDEIVCNSCAESCFTSRQLFCFSVMEAIGRLRAAEFQRRMALLRPALDEHTRAAQARGDAMITLPMPLDLAPMALQAAMSLGIIGPEHVAVQSIERLCVQALGLEREVLAAHPERYENLLAFARAQQAMFGRAATHLMHGQGGASNLASVGAMAPETTPTDNPAVFVARRNSGQHHPRTILNKLPAPDIYGGPQLTDLLNFYVAACGAGRAVTFVPEEGCVVILVDAASDGMLLGAGASVCERSLTIAGFEAPVSVDEAQRLLELGDDALEAWLQRHPLITTAMEFMLTTADAAVSGHLGFTFVSAEGDHKAAASRQAEMLSYTRICQGCLERAWADGMDATAAGGPRPRTRCVRRLLRSVRAGR